MKKLFISSAILLSCYIGTAQDKGKIEVGFNVGYNVSNVSASNTNSNSGTGINIGGSAEYYLSKTWGIKAKLIYDQKGWNDGVIQFAPDEPIYQTDFNLNYLTIPVTANWHFGAEKNWHLSFGPYLGILVSAKDTEFDTDLKDGFNSTDFGLAIGVGYRFPISDKMKLLLDYEGESGFTNIFKESSETVRNGRSSFNVGLLFLLK